MDSVLIDRSEDVVIFVAIVVLFIDTRQVWFSIGIMQPAYGGEVKK